jgi:hypothetical protein
VPRVVGNVVSPLTLAAPEGRAATLLGRAVQAAKGGALVGAEQPVEDGNENFLAKKLTQTGTGALVAGAIRPVTEGLITAVGRAVSPIVDFVKGVKGPRAAEDVATREVLRRIQQDIKGGGPTAQDMLDLLNTAPGKPLTLADVGGENLRGLAGQIARRPGEAKQLITKFLNERDLNAGLRLDADVQAGVAKGSAYQAAKALDEGRAAATQPLYAAAYKANQNVASDEIDHVLDTPAGKKALKDAAELMQNKRTLAGRPDPELLQQAKDAGQYVPFKGGVASGLKMQTLDYVKQALYDQESAAYRAGNNNQAKSIGDLRRALIGEMDRLDTTAKPGKVGQRAPTSGLYQQAREAYSGPSQSLDALQAGRDFMKLLPEEGAAKIAELSPGDREFYKLGAASTLRQRLADTPLGGDEAKKLVNSRGTQERLRPLFDSDADLKKFTDAVSAESRMFKTRFDILGGSQTAGRQAEDRALENEAYLRAGEGAIQAAHGNPLGAVRNWLGAARAFGRVTDPVRDAEIARLLTSPLNVTGPAGAPPGLQLLHDFSQYMPTTRNYLARGALPVGAAVSNPAGAAAAGQIAASGAQQ